MLLIMHELLWELNVFPYEKNHDLESLQLELNRQIRVPSK